MGTLSQHVLSQTIQWEEDHGLYEGVRGRVVHRRGARRQGVKAAKERVFRPLPTAAECLGAYQWLLREHAKTLVSLCDLPSILVDVVEHSWFSFLDAWTANSQYQIASCFHMAGKGFRAVTDASQDPNTPNPGGASQSRPSLDADSQRTAAPAGVSIRPSMLLLLGILHFGCRWIRSGLVANDILNMVRDGKLPWFCAWHHLPESLRSPVSLIEKFFRSRILPKSPASLTFLAENFAV